MGITINCWAQTESERIATLEAEVRGIQRTLDRHGDFYDRKIESLERKQTEMDKRLSGEILMAKIAYGVVGGAFGVFVTLLGIFRSSLRIAGRRIYDKLNGEADG